MISFREKKSFFILVLHFYLSICFTAVLQVSNSRLIKCRHLRKPRMWFARRTTLVGTWKMKQSNENHPLQLKLRGEFFCRCYSTDLWGDARRASGEEGYFSTSGEETAGEECGSASPKAWLLLWGLGLPDCHPSPWRGSPHLQDLTRGMGSASAAFQCLHCPGALSLPYT